MSANNFILKHGDVEVTYTVGITPGIPAFTYKKGADTQSFTEREITVNDTGVGRLVSVALKSSTDRGGERFGILLSDIDVTKDRPTPFESIGIYEDFSGPGSVPLRPATWRAVSLRGEARLIAVPLETAAA